MDTSAHLIEVVETVTEEVSATGAEVRIRLSGAKYFSGSAALEQASEVRKLVEALTAAVLAASDLGIASVRVDTSKGLSPRSQASSPRHRRGVDGRQDLRAARRGLAL